MKCPTCVNNGTRSTLEASNMVMPLTVQMGTSWRTFWDEEGRQHSHYSPTTYAFKCSLGHEFFLVDDPPMCCKENDAKAKVDVDDVVAALKKSEKIAFRYADVAVLNDAVDSTLTPPEKTFPIPMLLHCPACGAKHVDAPEFCSFCEEAGACFAGMESFPKTCTAWLNPPHRSHRCQACDHVWRPADVCTTGVDAIRTAGKSDSASVEPASWVPADEGDREREVELIDSGQAQPNEVVWATDAQGRLYRLRLPRLTS